MAPTWEITIQFVLYLAASFVVMKVINYATSKRPARARLNYLLLSPLLSMRSWEKRRPVDREALNRLLIKVVIVLLLLLAVYAFFPPFLKARSISPWARGYLAIAPFLIFAEGIGVVVQLLLLPLYGLFPPFLDRPYRSANLSDFWSRRWNPWLSGWFGEVGFRLFPRRPMTATWLAFLASGLWHELLIGVPLESVFKENIFGQWTTYFAIQAAGLTIGHRYLHNRLLLRRIWTWIIILLPAPLALNRGTLLIFQLCPP